MDLYSTKILELATQISLTGSLENPQISVQLRTPLCGSSIKIDLCITDAKISDFRQEIKACALGQASAAILSKNIIGISISELLSLKDQVRKMLKEGLPSPEKPFDDFEFLRPAINFKNRHDSILLPFDAIQQAIKKII